MKVYERMDIVAARHRFLLDVQKFREEGYKIYYQDETWCNAHHTRQFCWQHLSNPEDSLLPAIQWNGGFAVPSGEGQRLITCHAGSEDGFVQNSLLCFIGKSNTSDYHNEMNAKHFEEWWEEKLLPNLQDKSVVVIDNASIHSRLSDNSNRPNTSWRKAEIQERLRLKNISFEDNETNAILLMKVKSVYVPKIFMLEEITKKFCTTKGKDIKVLRLPVAHSELNPIELIWALIKGYVAANNTTFKIKDVKKLAEEAFTKVTDRNWMQPVKHILKVENLFRKKDFPDNLPSVAPVVFQVRSGQTTLRVQAVNMKLLQKELRTVCRTLTWIA